jgi:hypothetical protein
MIPFITDFVSTPELEKKLANITTKYSYSKISEQTIHNIQSDIELCLHEESVRQNASNIPKVVVECDKHNSIHISINDSSKTPVRIYNNIPTEKELLKQAVTTSEENLFKNYSDVEDLLLKESYKKRFELLYETASEYDCVDNFRVANLNDEDAVRFFYYNKRHGCCGCYEDVIKDEDGFWIVGFNYGH